jgi:predicted amidophosphoribosyltransferase
LSAGCKWCGQEHTGPVRHRNCSVCFELFVRPRKRGRHLETCGKPLCVAIQRYRQLYGRWPPRVWFERYAVKAGLAKVQLPKQIEILAARAA